MFQKQNKNSAAKEEKMWLESWHWNLTDINYRKKLVETNFSFVLMK